MLKSLIKAATNNLMEFYSITSDISHSGEKGGFREYFVNQLIRPFIPEHFGISSGIVIDSRGKQSSQSDVIIFDKRLMPPILQAEGKGIFPVECVLSVLEVKSKLCSSHLNDIILASTKVAPENLKGGKHNPNGLHLATRARTHDGIVPYPLYSVFAYESDADEKDEFQRLEEKAQGQLNFVSIICVLNKGVWRRDECGKIYKRISNDS